MTSRLWCGGGDGLGNSWLGGRMMESSNFMHSDGALVLRYSKTVELYVHRSVPRDN